MPRIIKIKCEYKECHGPALFGRRGVRSTLWSQRPSLPSVIILPVPRLCVWFSVCCSRCSLAPVSLLLYLVCSRVSVSWSLFVYLFVHVELVRFLFYFDSPWFRVCYTGLSWLISGLCAQVFPLRPYLSFVMSLHPGCAVCASVLTVSCILKLQQ